MVARFLNVPLVDLKDAMIDREDGVLINDSQFTAVSSFILIMFIFNIPSR